MNLMTLGNKFGVTLVDCQSLLRAVQRYAKCDECGAPMEVREDVAYQKSLEAKIPVFFTSCEKEDDSYIVFSLLCSIYSHRKSQLNTKLLLGVDNT